MIMISANIFIAFVALVHVGNAQESCGPDEIYTDCGSACPTTCTSGDFPPIACPAVCVPGCFCKPGLLRDVDGQCVSPDQCQRPIDPRCKPNEVFKNCGSVCVKTCDNIGKPVGPCLAVCRRGCFCKPGFVRNSDGSCVLPHQCPPRPLCGPDEDFRGCETGCPPTCADKDMIPRRCPVTCRRGCFCKDGLIRDIDGKCVLPNECSTPIPVDLCGANEIFTSCVIPCNDCISKNECKFGVCGSGCMCRSGYYRNTRGRCIPERQCRRPLY